MGKFIFIILVIGFILGLFIGAILTEEKHDLINQERASPESYFILDTKKT